MHYWRVRTYGTTDAPPGRVYPPKALCAIDGCIQPVQAHGWCNMHAGRWYRHGDPLTKIGLQGERVEVRFWAKVVKNEECWEWTAHRDTDGYGHFKNENRDRLAHRFAYELVIGPVPEGLQIDHLCRNRGCVNPAHMEPVTLAENVRRARLGIRTTVCKNGHVRTPENTTMDAGSQRCLICSRERSRERRIRDRH